MSFRETMPPEPPTMHGLYPWTPLGDFRSPHSLAVPPPPNSGYATVIAADSVDLAPSDYVLIRNLKSHLRGIAAWFIGDKSGPS